MAISIGELMVVLKANTTELSAGIKQAITSVESFGKNAEKSMGGFTATLKKVNTGVKDFAGDMAKEFAVVSAVVGAFAFKAVKSFADAEAAQRGLAAALRAVGEDAGSVLPGLQSLQKEIQRLTVYEDDQVAAAQRLAVNMGVQRDQLQNVTKAAVALGEYFGDDLSAATQAVSRAMGGQWRELQRMFPELKNANGEAERMAILNRKIAEGMDQARERINTTSGAWKQFTNVMGDVWESVGEGIVRGISQISGFQTKGQELVAFLSSDEFKGRVVEIFSKIAGVVGSVVKVLGFAAKGVIEMATASRGSLPIFVGVAATFAVINSALAKFVTVAIAMAAAYKGLQVLFNAAEVKGYEEAITTLNRALGENARQTDRIVSANVGQGTSFNNTRYRELTLERQNLIAQLRQKQQGLNEATGVGTQAARDLAGGWEAIKGTITGLGDAATMVSDLNTAMANFKPPAAAEGGLTPHPLRPGGGTSEEGGSAAAALDAVRLLAEEKKKLLLASLNDETERRQEQLWQEYEAEKEQYLKSAEAHRFTTDQVAEWRRTREERLMREVRAIGDKAEAERFEKLKAIQEEAAQTELELIARNSAQSLAVRIAELQNYRDNLLTQLPEAYQKANEQIAKLQEDLNQQQEQGARSLAEVTNDIHLATIRDRYEREREDANARYAADLESFKGTDDQKADYAVQRQALLDLELGKIAAQREIVTIERQRTATSAQKIAELEELRSGLDEKTLAWQEYSAAIEQIQAQAPTTLQGLWSEALGVVQARWGLFGEYVSGIVSSFTDSLSTGLQAMLAGTASFNDALKNLWGDMKSAFIKSVSEMIAKWAVLQAMTAMGLNQGGGGKSAGKGGGAAGAIASSGIISGGLSMIPVVGPVLGGVAKLFGFAEGGSFPVGGLGGTDSQLVAFRASPDETVSVTRPGRGAGPTVIFNNYGDINNGMDLEMMQRHLTGVVLAATRGV